MKKFIILSFFCFLLMTENNVFAQCCDYTYQQQVEPPTSAATFGVALGDFDGDGDLDAVCISAYYGIDVYFNNGSGTFTLNAQYATGTNADFYGVHVCDVDGDGDKDIIAIPFYTTTNLTVLKNNGSGIFTVSSYSSNIATYNAAVGDIDGDGDIDVFLPNAGGGSGKVFKNNGTGVYTLFQTIVGARGHDAALGDLDGDGDLDAFITENSTYGNSVFLNNGTGTFVQIGTNFGTAGGEVALADFDGDGDLDAWVGTAGNTSELWINNGSGVFTAGPIITTHPTWGYCKSINLYDMDADGDLDVFLGFYSCNPQVWTNNGNLSFSLCYQATVGQGTHGQAIGDLNGDGKIDIYSGYFSNTDGDYVFLNNYIAASISYHGSPFCIHDLSQQNVTQTGTTGGTYTASPSGLTIDPGTGAIIPGTSLAGTYLVTYTVGLCNATTSVAVSGVDTSTIVAGATITANQTGANYQWIDCNNSNLPISGQTNQSFTAPANGDYAVIITMNVCTDTSACVNITTVGLNENSSENKIVIYPNPASGSITVKVNPDLNNAAYFVFDPSGRTVLTGVLTSESSNIDITPLTAGIYMLKVGGQYHQLFEVKKK